MSRHDVGRTGQPRQKTAVRVRHLRLGVLVVTAAIAAAAARGGTGAGAEPAQSMPMTLPEVPLVAVASGADAQARRLPSQGRWLLVQTQTNCDPCHALLARIETDARAIAPRLAIVVAGSAPADVSRMMAGYAGLESAAWFADQPGGLFTALAIEEMPSVLAMNDRSVQWTLIGGLSGTRQLRDVLTGWVTVPGR